MSLFRVDGKPLGLKTKWILGLLPFLFVAVFYIHGSVKRHQENPKDKVLPNVTQLIEGAKEVVRYDPDIEGRMILIDTLISLKRLFLALFFATCLSLFFGVNMGAFRPIESLSYPFISLLAKMNPLTLLPILFILLGVVGEAPKITLIVLGVFPTMTMDIYMRAKELPRQILIKAYSLGASSMEVAYKVLMGALWPKVLDALRLALGPAGVFLIAAEAISAESGLGYRIYIVQRQLNMSVILLYVFWIALIGYSLDLLIQRWIAWRYPWYKKE